MSDAIRVEGVWWLPKAPKTTRSSGTLVVDAGGARLEAVIGPIADAAHRALIGPDLILGRDINGKLYTCLKTFVTNRTSSTTAAGTLEVAQLEVVNLWQGLHFKSAKDAAFKEGAWRYSNLHVWMYEAPAITLEDKGDESHLLKSLRKRGSLWEANVGDGITVANDFTFSYSWKRDSNAVEFLHFDGVRVAARKLCRPRNCTRLSGASGRL